ncbi:hypothetical protein, partial [Corynebacterium diphtheriae]|uniref:hypothetical protein n=1 Tax=Corynebacterium diphtheriae TaxID=1717 RepID=UPI003EB6A758
MKLLLDQSLTHKTPDTLPFVVVPFFFIFPAQTGHRGRFLDMKTNQTARASTSTVQNSGLVEIHPDILPAGIYTQLLAIVTSRL